MPHLHNEDAKTQHYRQGPGKEPTLACKCQRLGLL